MSSMVENEIRKKIPTAIQQDTDGAILTVLKTDNVGLLKDTKIPNPIPQEPTTNEPRIAINKDNVGLAKDTTLSSVLPRNLTQISGTALTARDWSSDFAKLQNLDVTLSVQAMLKRWGYGVEPSWIFGSEVSAPAAGTALVSKSVSTGKKGYIFGIFITAQEANDFKINWTSGGVAYTIRIIFVGKGTLMSAFPKAYNEGYPADADTNVTITNVNAGSTGIVYQAGLLYLEV